MRIVRNVLFFVVAAVIVAAVGVLVVLRLMRPDEAPSRGGGPTAVPVQVAAVEHGLIEDRRVFSGSLEATARVTIAPKVAGRITSLPLDIADPVRRGQVVAVLDSDEFEQAVAQVDAELAVANAELAEAQSAAEIAQRELERVQTLHERGVASDSQLDTARAEQLSKAAGVKVAEARLTRAGSAVESARIRLGYTTIRAEWESGDDTRVIAERFVEEGDTVSANTPLLSIIELNPIEAVIFATERDYAVLEPGQVVTLAADAYPDRQWSGSVARVAPVFEEGSRQARVEISVPNPDGLLKPGMFVRVEAVLGRADDATIVPVEALAERGGSSVVFVADQAGKKAVMVPVKVGIRQGDRVEVIGEGVEGRVVTLGQQLLGDESDISLPNLDGMTEAAGQSSGSPGASGG